MKAESSRMTLRRSRTMSSYQTILKFSWERLAQAAYETWNVYFGLQLADLGWVEFDVWFANPIHVRDQMRYPLEHESRSDL